MKKAFKIITLIILIFAADFIAGTLLEMYYFGQKQGRYARLDYSINSATDKMLIFGSSRATNNFIPSVIEEKFNTTCYNCGTQGQQMLYILALQRMILERYNPEVILFNIDYYFLNENKTNYDRLADLLPYLSSHKSIEDLIYLRSPYEKYKVISKIYPYNSKIARMVTYSITKQEDFKGYSPMFREIRMESDKLDYEKKNFAENGPSKVKNVKLDTNFIKAYEEFISVSLNKGIKVILTISPDFIPADFSGSDSYLKIKEISEKYNLSIMDFSKDSRFNFRTDLFGDVFHLNDKGAKIFTNILCDTLKTVINNNNKTASLK